MEPLFLTARNFHQAPAYSSNARLKRNRVWAGDINGETN
jgi:hypothetical protein